MCAWEYQQQHQNKGLIFFGIPYKTNFTAKVSDSWEALNIPEGFAYMKYKVTGQPLDNARNICVSKALQYNASHVFFLDEDVILKPDTLLSLKEANMPIIGALYYSRNPPYNVVANVNQESLTRDFIRQKREEYKDRRAVLEVSELGFGAILIDIRVFHRVAMVHNLPWFCMSRHPGQLDSLEKDDTSIFFDYNEAKTLNYKCKYCGNTLVAPFFEYRIGKYSTDALSEDYYFEKLARKTGFSIYLSLYTEVAHEITTITIDSDGLTNSTTSAGVA